MLYDTASRQSRCCRACCGRPRQWSNPNGAILGNPTSRATSPATGATLPAARGQQPADTWGGWFEWSFNQAKELTACPDEFVWAVGATFPSDRDPVGVPGNEAWHARHDANGFRHLKYNGWWRLFRCCRPEDLVDEETVERQGQALAEWIARSFRDLAADPPPKPRNPSA